MTKRFLTICALVSAAVVALLLVASLPTGGGKAQAAGTPTPYPPAQDTVNTSALVTGSGVAPNIECKWELPDMQVGVNDANPAATPAVPGTYPDARIQYDIPPVTVNGTVVPQHQHDDDMGTQPTVVPCDLPPAGATGVPRQIDNAHNMIQVVPVPQDDPEARHIQLWMAVDDPNGISTISDVFWQVWEPLLLNGTCHNTAATPVATPGGPDKDPCLKIQVHGTPVPKINCNPLSANTLGTSSTDGKMFEAAVHTGQMTAQAVDDGNFGMTAKCLQEEKKIYYDSFDLSKEQPCGEYRVDATAVGSTGAFDTLSNYLDIECVFYLKIDFNTVDWGEISPGYLDWVSGNRIWDNPPDNAPTVMNVGNEGMGLGVKFSKMYGQKFGKVIDTFDACFGYDQLHLQCIDPIAGDAVAATTFGDLTGSNKDLDPKWRTICSDEIGKLDLSIHPPSTLLADTYKGSMTVIGRLVKGICPAVRPNE